MFINDVVIFIKPRVDDLRASATILDLFAEASGLRVNLVKSATMPIRLSEEDMVTISTLLNCLWDPFDARPGVTANNLEATAAQFTGLVEQLATYFPTWRAASLPKSGRLLLVQTVLCTIPVNVMVALYLPPKTLEAMVKICRGFLWCCKAQVNGGNCATSWDMICAPKWTDNLGILNLGWLNGAMQA